MEEKIDGRFWLYPLAILLHTAMDGFDSTDAALMIVHSADEAGWKRIGKGGFGE